MKIVHEKRSTLLIVDAAPEVRKMLTLILERDDFKIVQSDCGKQALRMCVSTTPDLILLDLDLPDMNGKEVITAIREWSQTPIIVLSTNSADEEVIAALNLGANDYIIKPFNVGVLLARINASLRTCAVHDAGEPTLCNGALRIDLVRYEVFLHDQLLDFTPKEYDLLRHFMVNRGKMLTHKELLKKIWGKAHGGDITYLRVYVGQIRKKIDKDPKLPLYIITEPGIGYRMETVH